MGGMNLSTGQKQTLIAIYEAEKPCRDKGQVPVLRPGDIANRLAKVLDEKPESKEVSEFVLSLDNEGFVAGLAMPESGHPFRWFNGLTPLGRAEAVFVLEG